MITLIEAKNFRCLKYIRQHLSPFNVLVGPNASGKTTFLDIIDFLGDVVSEGLERAVDTRTSNFEDLLWGRSGQEFELAIEAEIPREFTSLFPQDEYDSVRYELAVGHGSIDQGIVIKNEKVLFKINDNDIVSEEPPSLFPDTALAPDTIITSTNAKAKRTIINKVPGGNDNFYSEVYAEKGKGWVPAFKLGPYKSALGNLPEDESKFPVSTWLKKLLTDGVQEFVLNSLIIRKASPPGQVRGFKPDGSNLPWVVDSLEKRYPDRFRDWIDHLKTSLPDLENIRTVERPDDKHRYLVLCYSGGLEVPSWMASDGTLRLLALTLPAYLPGLTGVFLIEEPENGIHPRAIETMFQSLSSVYDAQILMATHSPVILGMVDVNNVLCFAKTSEGSTDIVIGGKHPALRQWQGETNLGTLFAGGVLG